MTDELTRAIAESLREALPGYSIRGRGATSAEIAAALAPLIVQREQRAFDRGYDKAMEGIGARVREARAEGAADAYADVMRRAADESMACRRVAEDARNG